MAIRGRIFIRPRRRAGRVGSVAASLLVLALLCTACAKAPGLWTYQGKKEAAAGRAAVFSPGRYVAGIWSSKIQPTVDQKATEAPTLLAALAADADAAGAKYGHQSGTGSPFAYLIKGTGTVDKVDTTQPTGPITVSVTTPSGTKKLAIITGPVFAGTALRDAVGFIQFSQFINQIDYADVATQINNKVRTDVVARLDRAALKGKTIAFAGAFTYLPGAPISVIPTRVTVSP